MEEKTPTHLRASEQEPRLHSDSQLACSADLPASRDGPEEWNTSGLHHDALQEEVKFAQMLIKKKHLSVRVMICIREEDSPAC